MKKILILSLCFSLLPSLAFAAPAITSVSGTFLNDSILTVSGSNFNNIPAFKYKDFFDDWTEHLWNDTIPYVVDLGTHGGIDWKREVQNSARPSGIGVDQMAMKKIDGRAHYSTSYVLNQGYWWDSQEAASFEQGIDAHFDYTDAELWLSWYIKYGDEVTAWPSPYRETGSGKSVYIWTGFTDSYPSRIVGLPEITNCSVGDCNFDYMGQISPGNFVNNVFGTPTSFTTMRGKWNQVKTYYKSNTFTPWLNISSISRATSGVVTVQTSAPHGIIAGEWISVKDTTSGYGDNGFDTFTGYTNMPRLVLSAPDTTHLTYCWTYSGGDPTNCVPETTLSGSDGHIVGAHLDGAVKFWLNGVLKYSAENIASSDWPTNGVIRVLQFGGNHSGHGVAGDCEYPAQCPYTDQGGLCGSVCDWMPKNGTPSGSYPAHYYMIGGIEPVRYWDDVIASATDPGWGSSFVYISNKSTWGSGPTDIINGDSNFVRQVVGGTADADLGFKSWSNTSLKFKVNKGSLAGSTYLYVTNWSGETNLSGFSLISTPDTTPPAPPTGVTII